MVRLIDEIKAEKESITKTLRAIEKAIKRQETTIIELAAIATFLQNAYNGMENILKRALVFINVSIPSSASWHKDLLDLSVNNKIISFELSNRLDEYRAFRHFSIHGYGINLDKEKLLPLAENLPSLWKDFESEIEIMIKSLKVNENENTE
ncbi:MAG: hypothetical protein ACFFDN_49980 [Candidatus Hodarchaeota archaeon]